MTDIYDQKKQALEFLRKKENLSGCTSYVQRMLQCGYNRAANILEMLEAEGLITQADHEGIRHWVA